MCIENPQLGWGFRKAFSFEPVIKTPFDLLKHLAVWQLQVSNKKSYGFWKLNAVQIISICYNVCQSSVKMSNHWLIINVHILKRPLRKSLPQRPL
ncbi:hypothetical protein DS980_25060 [Escherichia coli]|nr:hypothetical protein DS980_25060 [Escherichia coli]